METKKIDLEQVRLTNKITKNILIIAIILVCIFLFINPVQSATIEATDSQYLEMRATDINEIDGQGKQVVFELWAHDIDFKGFDVRFSYDETSFEPSNLTTNIATDDELEYFSFESEFNEKLDMFTVPASTTNIIRAIISFNPPVDDSEHIKNETLISSGTDVLIGKISFKMLSDEFDITKFALVQDTNYSPKTGIKINTNGTDSYEAQSTFRFSDKTVSKDATLKDIKISTGIVDEINADNNTYKEYPITPTFESATKDYGLELNEYIDKMNIVAELSDTNSTMKMKVPKRDKNGYIVYDSDGTTIIYEEKDLNNKEQTEFTLNELGKGDTILEIIVTAEDGKTIEKYKVSIHRPYGTIRGTIEYGNSLKDSYEGTYGITVNTDANIKAYKTGDFNWDDLASLTLSYDDLNLVDVQKETKTNGDTGQYEILLIPGQYDIFMENIGFLTSTVRNINLNENDIIELGTDTLYAGDTDRNGMIDLNDMVDESYKNDSIDGDGIYETKYDFSKKGYVSLDDLVIVYGNQDLLMNVRDF